jgi:two-component system NtrC family sensor kinase
MEEKGYGRLRLKIIVTTLCFSLIPLFVLGASLYYQFHISYKSKIIENLKTLSENRRDAIDLFFDERISQLTTLAHTLSFDRLSHEDYLDEIFRLIQMRSKSYVDLGVIDQVGNHVAYVGPYNLKEVNYKDEEWFHAVMLEGVYISDVFMGFRKFPHFIIAVKRREGKQNWILRATIDTKIFDGMVKAAQVGRRGDAFILNEHGVLQTQPRFDRDVMEMAPHFAAASKFSGTQLQDISINGSKALIATTWLRNKDWLLVVREDPQEELLPLFRAQYMGLGLVVVGILLIVGGTILTTRYIIAKLIEADREKAMLDASLIESSKMAALGKLAAGIAHEVNNPLAVIKEKVGWVRDLLVEEDLARSENFREFQDVVNKIDYHVERAKKVTHRLLGFARRMEPTLEIVDANKVLQETLSFLENEALFRNIDIQADLAQDLPQIKSDSAQLQQVFLNILNNAIDAIGKDGQIHIRTTHNTDNHNIAISFSDTGPGIPRDTINKIFEPFFTDKGPGKGTGLGLSISYSIIEKLGGNITVTSEEGKGATFVVSLPVK